MDTPATESTGLAPEQATALMAQILDGNGAEEPKKEDAEPQAKAPPEPEAKSDAEPQEEDAQNEDETITIEVDGKLVEVKKSELSDLVKGNLRQSDYTKKTMEVAEQRKAAEAEIQRARAERMQYAQGLQQAQAVLQAQLQEQSQTNWQQLLETDPVEYLKQQHLAQQRQAQLNQVMQQQQALHARNQHEQALQLQTHLQSQQQELLAKLPEWRDESKAKADREAIKTYLKDQGLADSEISTITDHRLVLLARKAMLHDQMIQKASAATKKVSNLPQKVERAGVQTSQNLDKRQSAFQRLSKSGKVEDAAAVFAGLI